MQGTVAEAMSSAVHILNDGKTAHATSSYSLQSDTQVDVERAEAELSKGTSPFHKVRHAHAE